MGKLVQSLLIGLKRRWKRAAATCLSVLGAIWLLTEVLTRVSNDLDGWIDRHGTLYIALASAASAIGFLLATYEPREVGFVIPGSATKVTLKFSSIFNEDAHWIIGVNEYFDSILGNLVAANSLHGKIIATVYNGNQAAFRNDVDAALTDITGETVERMEGQNIRYPLGTTAVIARGPRKIFLVAISNTDVQTHRSSSSVPILWEALGKAISKVDAVGNGEPLALPLIGNGRASLNIPPQHILRLIILRLIQAAKQFDLPRNITINLSDDCFEHLDLLELTRGWSLA